MKFWFFSDGAVVMLLVLSTIFCDQDLPFELHAPADNKTMAIPCSLDENERNATDCENITQTTSNLPESLGTSNPNSSEDLSGMPESEPTTLSKINNPTDNITATEYTTIILSNETFTNTPCPPEGCSISYKPEENISEISSESTLTTLSKTNDLIENTVETDSAVATTIFRNETYMFENSSTSESILITEETSETVSNTTDVNELSLKELHNSSLPYSGNASMTSQASTTINDIPNVFSTSLVGNFSEESQYTDDPLISSITTHHLEENYTITHNSLYPESNVTNTFDHFSHISEVTNSTENIMTETTEAFIHFDNITGQDSNASLFTTPPVNESLVESTTTDSFVTTETVGNLTINVTSAPDNTSPFYTMPVSSNTSDLSVETSTWIITEENTNLSTDTSESLIDTTTMASSESPLTPHHRVFIVLELRINCSENKQEKEIALSVAQLLNATLKESYDKNCSNLHNVTLSIVQDSKDFATIYKLLSKLKNAELIRVLYDENSANTTSKNITISESDVTKSEMILYITLGVCLGAIFLIALVIICFKCCRRHPSKPIDLDVPHLNLRLEDYTLTRIPRPNTVYLDYFRGPIVSDRYSSAPLGNSMNTATEMDRGLVQPFDTSVVPLEDAKKLDELATSPGRTSSLCPSTPLRTFGRKDWKRGDNLIYENVISSSTEKLHPDFYKYGYPGMENPTFAA